MLTSDPFILLHPFHDENRHNRIFSCSLQIYMRLYNTDVLMIVNKDGPEQPAHLATLIWFQQNCMGVFARNVCSSHSYIAMRNVLCLIDARKTPSACTVLG